MQGLGVNLSWVKTPVVVPELPEHHVSRPELVDALRGSRHRLILLSTPAGYGKTVLLDETFASSTPAEQVLWLRLGGRSLSLVELTDWLATALGLSSNPGSAALLRHFAKPGRPVRLVLDDLPGDLSIELNNWFEHLLNLPESHLRLTITSRQRPAWNLPRLLLRGELLELDATMLGMSRQHFDRLCDGLAGPLDAVERESLWARSGGWWGGVCLLLAGRAQGARLLGDYLEHEVLVRLSGEERHLFYGLCHLPRFSTELCAQLWEGRSSAQLLQRLRQQQVFVQPIEGLDHWYRIHPLVAVALQPMLDPAELARLRLQSCRLLSVAGQLHEAIDQALQAQQPEVAATYMERLQPTWQLTDRYLQRVLDWRRQLPQELLESTAGLIDLSTLALLFSGRIDEALASLEPLGRFLPAASAAENQRLLAHWQALRGGLYACQGQHAVAELHCREALLHLREDAQDGLLRLLCQFSLERTLMAAGRIEEAGQVLQAALEQVRRRGCLDSEALLQGDQLRLLMLRGETGLAELLLEDALAARVTAQIESDPLLGRLLFIQAELALLSGRTDEAERGFLVGLQHTRDCSAPFILQGYLGLAEVASRRGDPLTAQLQLHRGEQAMHYGRVEDLCYRPALALQRLRGLARQGDWLALLDGARRLVGDYPLGSGVPASLPPTLPQEAQLLAARAEYRLGRFEQARHRLQQCLGDHSGFAFECLRCEARQLLDRLAEQAPEEEDWVFHEELTGRESAVLGLLAEGLSNQEIADSLYLSVNTVKYHAKNINAKLGVTRRTQAIACAKARGLLA
ncbi:LuxR C-terminal-related transcriptional regulator [Pseudomonas nitroreducens]|uniref:ATP-dependent transcriptional regulator n=1 Tax=Pseudomonas nitroreducens TaxID=46680 RepID=A0A246F7W5_PSENT|nr:LuxR C-terminal-related transcriptional regulator [Pseudomonas nitroreducens]OWP49760.1 ATP-dependent transcriptional regulator [Pseudomonas nitroreducens]